jgi:hypothetical protein
VTKLGDLTVVLQPQHASQHSQVLVLHNGNMVCSLAPLT